METTMSIEANHWAALVANAEAEARKTHPNDPEARRRLVSRRLGIITKADLEDMEKSFLTPKKPGLLDRLRKMFTKK